MNYSNIFHGCLKVIQKDGEYCPQRFNDDILDFYEKDNPAYLDRAITSATVTMEFLTSENEISFDFEINEPLRDFITFDICENGVFTYSYIVEVGDRKGTVTYKKECEGESQFKIHMPIYAKTTVKNINIGEYKVVCKDHMIKYLAIGDSITHGMVSETSAITYPGLLAEEWNANLLNVGVGGFYFNDKSLDENLGFEPDIITVAYGTNDSGRSTDIEVLKIEIDKFMAKLQKMYGDKQIYMITPLWRGDLKDAVRTEILKGIRCYIKERADFYNFYCIDGLKIVPHATRFFAPDQLHPNALGFEEMAKNINKEVLKTTK